MKHKVIIIGAGGFAKVVADIIEKNNDKVIGVLDDNLETDFLGKYKVLGKIADAKKFNGKNVEYIIAIGNIGFRKQFVEKNKELKYYTAIHPTAIMGEDCVVRAGSVICANVTLNPNVTVKNHTIINATAVVEHDVIIDNFVNIDANATILGEAIVCEGEHIATDRIVQRKEVLGKANLEEDLVSIITPVYNAEKYIDKTISCILEQTYTNWELILVDDKSKDKSIEKIKKYNDPRIKLIKVKKNGGPAMARNLGIDNAKGRFLCFQDADDLWEKDKLEKQVNFMKKNNIAFSYTSYEFADSEGVPNGKKVIVPLRLAYKDALKNTTISTITVMFDVLRLGKELIKMPNLSYGEDTAAWWKVLRSGVDAYGLQDVMSYYRRTNSSLSANKLKTLLKVWNLYTKVERINVISAAYYFVIRNIKAFLRRI